MAHHDFTDACEDRFAYRSLLLENQVGTTYSAANVSGTEHTTFSLLSFLLLKTVPFLRPTNKLLVSNIQHYQVLDPGQLQSGDFYTCRVALRSENTLHSKGEGEVA